MTMTDPIADMLTRIRNTLMIGKEEVRIPFSKIKLEIAKILEREGWVDKTENKYGEIIIRLKYHKNQPAIKNLKRISKPGRRIYVSKDKLPIVLNNYGMAIISTSRGLMTNREAKRKKIGGEIICEIY